MGVKTLQISPNNVPANGKISFRGGLPVISFTIGTQNAILDPASIRISGNFDVFVDADGTTRPSVGGANFEHLTASEKLGVYGCFNQLVWRNSKSKQVAEHIRHYARFMASYLPVMSSLQDQYSFMSQSALITPSSQQFQKEVIQPDLTHKFCCPLPSGMTMAGEKLNLFPNAFGGLECEIHLTPDSQFFCSDDGSSTNLLDTFYQLSDVKIFCEVYEPDTPQEMQKFAGETKGVFNFNSISSYMTTLESTQSIINFNLGLSRVISAFVNFVPSSFLNNRKQNGFLTYFPIKGDADGTLAEVDNTAFLKMGERFPYEFVVSTNVDNGDPTENLNIDPQVNKYFTSSLIPEHLHRRCSISPVNTNRNFTGLPQSYTTIPEGGPHYGVGVLYDLLDSDGVNFKTESFTLQMETELDDANPVSAFLFVKAKQTLAFSPSGIEVIA
tara:strand:+ start:1844 stop:3169 length:1326 start_codon:yes stop_codon:yes gene_type:complete